MREGHRRALADGHLVAAARERQRLPQADDAGAADGDVALLVGHCGFFSKGLAAKRLIPERHAFAAWVGAAFKPVRRDGDDGKAAGEGEALDLMAELAHAVGERIPLLARLEQERLRRSSRNWRARSRLADRDASRAWR